MRVTRIFGAANWKYAVGETFLIVVGVTIALAATSWYEDRRLREEEVALLQEIRTALGDDLEAVTENFKTIRQVDQNLVTLVDYLESGQPYSDEISTWLPSIGRFVVFTIRSGPYETLKARGFDLISNGSLRGKLTSLYEDAFPALVTNSEIDRRLCRDRILPYMLENFLLARSGGWIPKDYDAMKAESGLSTLGRYRSGTLKFFYLPSFEETMELMEEILAEIDDELAELGE